MTIETENTIMIYRGNGSATEFPFDFQVDDINELVVRRRIYATGFIDLTYGQVDYTVEGLGESEGGTVTMLISPPLPNTYELLIYREVEYKQELELSNQSGFLPESIEQGFDRLEMQIQQLKGITDRSLRAPPGDTMPDLPAVGDRKSKYAYFNGNGDLIGVELPEAGDETDGTIGNSLVIESRAFGETIDIPSNIDFVITGGYYIQGDGGGCMYQANSLFTPTDTCSFQSADGQWWFPILVDGINVLQFGAIGDGEIDTAIGTDNQPFIQSILDFLSDYGTAGSVVKITFPAGVYKCCSTLRTTNPSTNAADGNVFVFNNIKCGLIFEGAGATLFQRGYGDVDIATTWQVVSSKLWRGNIIQVLNTSVSEPLGPVIFRDLDAFGMAGKTGYNNNTTAYAGAYFPANTATNTPNGPTGAGVAIAAGDGWDLTHRFIFAADQYTTSFKFFNCRLQQFRGEIVLLQGANNGDCYFDGSCEIGDTNGDCISVSGTSFITEPGLRVHDAGFAGIENGCYSSYQRIDGIHVENCNGEGITLVGINGAVMKGEIINPVLVNCAKGIVLSGEAAANVRIINPKLIDCGQKFSSGTKRGISLIATSGLGGSHDVRLENIEIINPELICDTKECDTAIILVEAGSYVGASKNVRIVNYNVTRTTAAATASRNWVNALELSSFSTNFPELQIIGGQALGCDFHGDETRLATDYLLTGTGLTTIAEFAPIDYPAVYEVGGCVECINNADATFQVVYWDSAGGFQTTVYNPTLAALTGLNATALTAGTSIPLLPITIRPQTGNGGRKIQVKAQSSVANALRASAFIRRIS